LLLIPPVPTRFIFPVAVAVAVAVAVVVVVVVVVVVAAAVIDAQGGAEHAPSLSLCSWGGYLPKLNSKNGNGEAHALDAGAMSLLKSAMADQKHDTAAGKAARARDQAAFKRMGGKMSVSMGKVHEEATKEFQHIEQRADIGLGRATAVDDAEDNHAWGHMRG